MKNALQLACLRQPFRKALLIAARLGVRAVEIDCLKEIRADELTESGVGHVRKLLSDTNMRVSAASFRTARGYDVLEGLDRRVDATKKAMRLAYALGARVLVNSVGFIPPNDDTPLPNHLLEALIDIGRFSQHVGVQFAALTGAEEGSILARLLAQLPPGTLSVALDPGLLVVNGFAVSEAVSCLLPHIVYAYATDGVRDLAHRRGLEVPLGRGAVNFPLIVATLAAASYDGYLCVQRQHCEHPEEEIAHALKFLENL